MNSNFQIIYFLLGFVLVQSCAPSTLNSKKLVETPPNILVILLDDLGYADVGFNGCKDIPTPNIDRIAEGGVKFTNGYVSYAVCGPSRAGLITGRYQDRFGFGRNPLFAPNDINQGLPLSEQTLASALGTVGYKSIALGKWHLGAHEAQRPMERGFDEFFGFLTGGHKYFPSQWTLKDISEVDSQYAAYNTKLLKNNQRVEESEYLTDALSREAVDYIKRNQDQAFFMYLAYNAPHAPLQATEKYLNRFPNIQDKKRKTYAAMVSAVDDGVGKILDQLEEMNLTEKTIIFFLSDNGGPSHRNGSNNAPLRGKKGDLLEGGIRVPFAMQWKGRIPGGLVYENPIISLDIFATAVTQAGAKPKNPLDGVDLIPYLTSAKQGPPHQQLFWRKYDANIFAVRSGNLKLLRENKSSKELIYDLPSDIGELNGMEEAIEKVELKKLYDQWNDKMMDPVFLGLIQNKEYTLKHPNRFNIKPY